MERHPTTEEHERRNARHDEKIEIFRKIEESEMYTGILCMVARSQLMLCFGKVERTTVCLSRSGDDVDQESDYCRNMSFEDEPSVILSPDKLVDVHCSGKKHYCDYSKPERQFITYHLRAASHGADKRILVIT